MGIRLHLQEHGAVSNVHVECFGGRIGTRLGLRCDGERSPSLGLVTPRSGIGIK